jgi:hypothetical protein
MANIIKPEQIKTMDLNVLPQILQKLTLYNLSELYKHFNGTLEQSNKLISEVYKDAPKETMEMKIHREQVYEKCMKNIKYSEIILFHIKNECNVRNIGERFGIVI